MRAAVLICISFVILSGCTGHQYEPREPGVSISGEAGIGVKYQNGKTTPVNNTKINVHIGGSI